MLSVDDMPAAEMRWGAAEMGAKDGEYRSQPSQPNWSQCASSIVSTAHCRMSRHREITKRGSMELSDGGGEAGLLALMCSGAHASALQRF